MIPDPMLFAGPKLCNQSILDLSKAARKPMLLESPKRLITNTDLLVRRLLNLTVVKEDIVELSL